MNRLKIVAVVLVGVAWAGMGLRADQGAPASTATASGPASGPIKLKGISIDVARRQVVVDAQVSLVKGGLEFLLCLEGTKDYESLLTTKAMPSSVHAALLALGLMPGKGAHWTTPPGKDPIFEPPRGALLDIKLRWLDGGQLKEVPATGWMLTTHNDSVAPATHWVFVGSDILDSGKYWADEEGRLISVSNFAASVIDVPFASTDKNAALEYMVNSDAVPAKGTPVQVVITAVKGAETAPVARVVFSVDAVGRIRYEGEPIAPEKIEEEMRKFLSRHAQGVAEVKIDPQALVFDRERLANILQQAGISDISFRTAAIDTEILPRTREEAAKAVSWWKEQFADADEQLFSPVKAAQKTLAEIERRQKESESTGKLLVDYADQLKAMLAEYRKKNPATQGSP